MKTRDDIESRRSFRGLLIGLIALLPACALEIPEPPDLAPLNEQYENPTADFGPRALPGLLGAYAEQIRELQLTGKLQPVRELAADFENRVDVSDEAGDELVRVDGLPLKTDAVIHLHGRCLPGDESGYDDIVARAVTRGSELVPTIWGEVRHCRVDSAVDLPVPIPETTLWGEASVHMPAMLNPEKTVYLIQYDFHRVVVNGEERAAASGSVRYVDGTLELLVNQKGKSVVVFVESHSSTVGIRAANGVWKCDLEKRKCEQPGSSEASWYF
jgi:hypothetical protein